MTTDIDATRRWLTANPFATVHQMTAETGWSIAYVRHLLAQLAYQASSPPRRQHQPYPSRALLMMLTAHYERTGLTTARSFDSARYPVAATTIRRRFGTWNNALTAAGLPHTPHRDTTHLT